MDQVFLQDSIPPRRHPTRRALKRETPSQPPQSASPVGPGENQLLGLKLITSSPLKPHSRITMTNHGDDCYFFYYSTCAKGDSCPFRHCEAAMGNETVCSLWQEGRCFRTVCKFRHMKITKNRKEIPCYWENQPAGCQKAHCAFSHEKPRYIEGIFMPPDKSLNKNEEQQQEETPPPPAAAAAAALPTTANPQLRGIIKTETQEPVPSPTHPPVVINPADDDEDEDDQFSEEGEDGKFGPSPRKLPKSDDSLNFGVSTLEEIRLRKALKASMKKAGYPIQSAETSANGEKENIQSFFRPAVFESRDGTGVARGSVNERLVRKIPNTDVKSGEGVRLKRSLAERLGRIVDVEEPSTSPQKSLKPVKERLGLLSGPAAPTQSAETVVVSKKVPEHIHIKTLEEIKQEKAAKCQSQNDASSTETPEVTAPKSAATKSVKRAITAKHSTVSHVKTFSEVIRAKKKRQEEEKLEPSPISKKAKHMVEDAPGKSRVESDAGGPGPAGAAVGKVRVKTLEEIRKEKAARIQAQQTREAEIKKSSDTEENGTKKPRLLAIKKTASQSGIITTEESSEVTEKPLKTSAAASETSNSVKVKTFEEIMQEKRLRKQEMDEQAKSSAEAELSQNRTAGGSLKRNALAKISLASSSSPSSATPVPDSTQNPVRKRIPLEAKAASPLKSMTTRNTAAAALPTVAPVSSAQQAETESQSSSREVLDKNTRNSTALSPMKPAKTGPPGPATDAPAAAKTQNNNQKKPPECTADTKVRPKLNVKPSVMKPAVQVKPGQKRKAAERSAVAAVKPLNSASTVQEEPLQETACRDRQVFPSFGAEAHLISAVPCSPTTLLDNGSSPPREELQTVPDFKQSPGQEKRTVASTVPQSPVRKTPTQPKSRRASVAASRIASTSAMDDFEELINEFTDDHLEEDVDPGIGEDVLLRELSEMIDS